MKRSWMLAATLALGLAQAQTVNLMWSGAITGPTSDAGAPYAAGVEDYCRYANETNAVPGVTFNCIVRDDQYNNANTQRNFEEAIDLEVPIFLGYSTGGTLQLKPLVQEVGVPVVPASMHIGNIDPPNNDYIFLPTTSYSEQVIALLEFIAKESPGAKVALVVHPSAFGRAPIEDARRAAEELGIEIVEVQETGANLDYTAMLTRFAERGVQYVVHQNVAGPVAQILKDSKRLGLNLKHAGAHYTGGEDLLRLAGDAADGFLWATSFYLWNEDAPGIRLQRELGERYGRSEDIIRSVNYTNGMMAAGIAIEAVRIAKEKFGEVNAETVYQALMEMNWDSGFGVGPVTYGPDDHTGVDHLRVLQAKDGAFQPISEPFTSALFRKVHFQQ
ncbi:ABC transporter substrate-binding protein [Marinithermus hydrothermalis]|uniref:Amino acid/amide ABC transporter substrate-binding protein, haat family n=1 Tax=Marinithermus hydrothermalis (strain DSM 14884 / JCM 11576 / T1) TaxID=869210 RepID=F2NK69_MARHT|nr:ABC transporter substrate-binding protein [Marinithermus hydrothermalis]AEB12040.1 amino acid/amide ABC transporter substrate-binding protein, haat family [Marinithermus hydrothermalis DSM 14884]